MLFEKESGMLDVLDNLYFTGDEFITRFVIEVVNIIEKSAFEEQAKYMLVDNVEISNETYLLQNYILSLFDTFWEKL